MVVVLTKYSFKKAIPYISLFVFLFGLYLVFDLVNELNRHFISQKIDKLLGILLSITLIISELSKVRDSLWKVWKNMSIRVHIVVTLFFSFIILRLFPVAWQKVWSNEDEKQNLDFSE
ncbi:MAG: hypothetical protein AAB656_00490 [Patescibacteria group bacterium]